MIDVTVPESIFSSENEAVLLDKLDVVHIDVLTPPNALNQEQKSGFTAEARDIVNQVSGNANLGKRTWVLIREAVDGGWGIAGHAFTNAAIAELVRKAQAGTC